MDGQSAISPSLSGTRGGHGGFPSWRGNFRRQACRPRNGVIFCVCEFFNWGLDAPCQIWKQFWKMGGGNPGFCRRINLGGHFLAPSYRIYSNFWFSKQRQTRRKHWETKLESCTTPIWDFVCWMRCHLPRNNYLRALFGAILPNPIASVPAFKPSESDLEILRSESPQHGPVWVQHAFECTMWGDFIFFLLFATLKVTNSGRLW